MQRSLPVLVCLTLASACPAQQPTWKPTKPPVLQTILDAHDIVYDSARQRMVLSGTASRLGGTIFAPVYTYWGETWEYDATTWTQRKPQTSPPARLTNKMVYDSARQRVVLFGGGAPNRTTLRDTWEYDGTNWTQRKPQTSPPGRCQHEMVYDSSRHRTVLFGGSTVVSTGVLGDTWEYDGTNWKQLNPKTSPSARSAHAMAYDPVRKRVVLFGGRASTTLLADTWEFDGTNWTQMQPQTSPPARVLHVLEYDSARDRVVLNGGADLWGGKMDTWEWDGKTWTEIKQATLTPGGGTAMAYDCHRRRMVLPGGMYTWELGAGPEPSLRTCTRRVSIASGGTQLFTLDAGSQHASRLYWVLGSVTGTTPGVTLVSAAGSVNIPLNPDPWTDYTILGNSPLLVNTKATLDKSGKAQAAFRIPGVNIPSTLGLIFYHAYLVYDAKNNFYMASNPVSLQLVK